MIDLDQIDKELLNILQTDAKQSTKAIAAQLHLSPTAIYERIKRLERNNYIKSYIALVDPEKIRRDFVVFCMVQLSQHSRDEIIHFEQKIIGLEEVVECYHLSGTYDYMLKIRTDSMKSYRQFMIDQLTTIPHIANTQSAFSINELKDEQKMILS